MTCKFCIMPRIDRNRGAESRLGPRVFQAQHFCVVWQRLISNKMASFAASLLDDLMGRNRNALPTDSMKELSYHDAKVSDAKICIFR